MQRAGKFLTRVLFWTLLLCAFLLALKRISDPDALLHLGMGKLFWMTNGYPATEPFCYPAEGLPFLYTSWLFALGSYLTWALFGVFGLSVGVALVTVLLAWILYRDSLELTGQAQGVVAVLVVLAALMLSEDRFVLRPEMVLYLAFSACVWLLGRYVFTGGRKALWCIPPIALLWANCHSSITLIVVPFAAFAAYLIVEIVRGRDSDARHAALERLKWLGIVLVLSLLAALLNPNLIGQFQYGQTVMAVAWYKQSITELLPPRAKELAVIWPVFAVSVITTGLALRRRAIPYLLINVALLYVALMAIRFYEFFCLMQAPILARSLTLLAGDRVSRFVRPALVASLAVAMLTVAGMKAGSIAPFKRDVISLERFGLGYNLQVDHERAVAFLASKGIRGRVFNVFEDGQSIIWHGWPDLTVFIDGRGAIPESMLEAYSNAFADPAVMSGLQKQFGFEALILGRSRSFEMNPHGAKSYFYNPDWSMVYFDANSYVYLRKNGPYANMINGSEFKYLLANADIGTYLDFIARNPAYANGIIDDFERAPQGLEAGSDRLLMGYSLYKVGEYARAAEVLAPIRNISHQSLLLYGHVLKALGRVQEARAVYDEGAQRFKTNDFVEAAQTISTTESVRVLLEQAAGLITRKDYAAARKLLEQVLNLDGRNAAALANLGYCDLHDNRLDEAERNFAEALKVKADYDVALYGMGLVQDRQGRVEQAKLAFEKFIQVQTSGPYHEKAKAYLERR